MRQPSRGATKITHFWKLEFNKRKELYPNLKSEQSFKQSGCVGVERDRHVIENLDEAGIRYDRSTE